MWWPLLATASSASSTLVYLILAHHQSWGPAFIQLYTLVGLLSGWSNALIYYLAPHILRLQGRFAALAFYLAGIAGVLLAYGMIFHHPIGASELSFAGGALIPVLYANAFGLAFSEGNYPWPYKRTIAFNLLLLFAAVSAAVSGDPRANLFAYTGVAGAVSILFWSFDRWIRVKNEGVSALSVRAWLNPAVPILERSVWDQWLLSRFQFSRLSVWIYLLGRAVALVGNFSFSYLMGQATRMHSRLTWECGRGFVALAVGLFAIGLSGLFFTWTPLVFAQAYSWVLGALMTLWFRRGSSRNYHICLLFWATDLLARMILAGVAPSLQAYMHYSLALVFTELVALTASFRWSSELLRERTSTILRPAGSPGTR